MMSFTRDTASVHKLEPKKKKQKNFDIWEKKMFIQSDTGSLEEKIRVLPAGVEPTTYHWATGGSWVLRPLN